MKRRWYHRWRVSAIFTDPALRAQVDSHPWYHITHLTARNWASDLNFQCALTGRRFRYIVERLDRG